jgi:hypothetical protein
MYIISYLSLSYVDELQLPSVWIEQMCQKDLILHTITLFVE